MEAIWSPQSRYRIWFEIEAHATDKLAELGVVPASAAKAVWKARDMEFDVARIDEIEREVKHRCHRLPHPLFPSSWAKKPASSIRD